MKKITGFLVVGIVGLLIISSFVGFVSSTGQPTQMMNYEGGGVVR